MKEKYVFKNNIVTKFDYFDDFFNEKEGTLNLSLSVAASVKMPKDSQNTIHLVIAKFNMEDKDKVIKLSAEVVNHIEFNLEDNEEYTDTFETQCMPLVVEETRKTINNVFKAMNVDILEIPSFD